MPFGKDFIKESVKRIYDELNRFLTCILIVLLIVTIFIHSFVLDLSKFILFALILFRLFSKNKSQRNKENQLYLKITRGLIKPFISIKSSMEKRKTNIYKKCHKCKTILKLPLPEKRGIKHAKCPNCGERVMIIALRKKKLEKVHVEVIKKARKGE